MLYESTVLELRTSQRNIGATPPLHRLRLLFRDHNARFSDSETLSLLRLLDENTDHAEIMVACVDLRLDRVKININPGLECKSRSRCSGCPEHF